MSKSGKMSEYLYLAFNPLYPSVLLTSWARPDARNWSMAKKIPPKQLILSFFICTFAVIFLIYCLFDFAIAKIGEKYENSKSLLKYLLTMFYLFINK